MKVASPNVRVVEGLICESKYEKVIDGAGPPTTAGLRAVEFAGRPVAVAAVILRPSGIVQVTVRFRMIGARASAVMTGRTWAVETPARMVEKGTREKKNGNEMTVTFLRGQEAMFARFGLRNEGSESGFTNRSKPRL